MERTDCDGVWEQVAGEKKRPSVTVFGNWMLERGEFRM